MSICVRTRCMPALVCRWCAERRQVTGAGVGSPPAVRSPVASAARAICFALRLGSTTLSRVGRPPARDAVTALGPRDRAEPARPCVAVERQRDRAALCISRARRTPPVALPLTRLDKMVLSKPIYFTLSYILPYQEKKSCSARVCETQPCNYLIFFLL